MLRHRISVLSRLGSPARSALVTAVKLPKSVELETRLSRLEGVVYRIDKELELTNKRLASLQAHFDHLIARLGR